MDGAGVLKAEKAAYLFMLENFQNNTQTLFTTEWMPIGPSGIVWGGYRALQEPIILD